jgi:bacterioferritin-associated ferredoxin
MYICICNSVTDSDIREAAARGARSLDAIQEQLGVASCCGSCACAAEQILNEDGPCRGVAVQRAMLAPLTD